MTLEVLSSVLAKLEPASSKNALQKFTSHALYRILNWIHLSLQNDRPDAKQVFWKFKVHCNQLLLDEV